MQNIHRPD